MAPRKKGASPRPKSRLTPPRCELETSDLPPSPLFVVGLGASAGGLETLEEFFTNTPPDTGMAFVVVVHLDPTHKTLLPELLARYTQMEVCLAEEGMTVEPNRVYVIPANRDLTVNSGLLHLEEPLAPRGMRHTIDTFLRSLAADLEENAIAVILSGTGTDGTQGVKAIKEAGGIVVVQDQDSAKYPGMPQSAIATGLADFICAPAKMPEKIHEFASRSALLRRRGTDPSLELTDRIRSIFRVVHSRTGHDFSGYKASTLMRRVERRMAVTSRLSVEDYIALLKDDTDEPWALFKEVLIGVTSFFRDPEAFDALREQVIPQIFQQQKDPDEPLRVWMAGCATGEEAYSVAILLREYARDQRLNTKIQLFATDIDGQAIDFGRAGVYPDSISADVSPERLKTFFKKVDSSYHVAKSLRETIVFAQHNLVKDPPFSRLDLLVCRNLLIYLTPELQQRLLPLFYQALKPEGFLFLGSSETVGNFTDLFRPMDKKWKLFQRRAVGRKVALKYPLSVPAEPLPKHGPLRSYREEGIRPGDLAEKILLQRYTPPCVVINDKYEVVHFSTRTSRFLEPPVGEPSQDILKMAKDDLRPALRAAIHKAFATMEPVTYQSLKLVTGAETDVLNLRVEPIVRPAAAKGLALVMFEPVGMLPLPELPPPLPEPLPKDDGDKDTMLRQLEEQLRITHEQLQSTVERLETSNEELKSSNEELMSMNEEFQSTNEELETSKEELQALNEELVTLNAELQSKVEELGQANNDMQNLLNSSDIATIFLDRQLRVKHYSPAMAKVFNLLHSDLGRPLAHLSGRIAYPDLQHDAEQVLQNLTPVSREVSTHDGDRSFLMRVLPYRTMEDVIDGIVITLVDISERKSLENNLREIVDQERQLRTRLEALMEAVPVAVLVASDPSCRTIYGNRAAEQLLRVPAGANISKNDPEAPVRHFRVFHDGRELRPEELLIQRAVTTGEQIIDYSEDIVFDNGDRIAVYGNAVPLRDPLGQPVGAIAVIADITPRVRMEEELRQARQVAEEANQAKSNFLATVSHEIRTPLSALLGVLELLDRTTLTTEQRNFLHMGQDSGNNLLRLLTDLLDFSKIEAHKLTFERLPFDVRPCIVNVVELMTPQARAKGLELSCQLPEDLDLCVVGDCERLQQVLLNLIGNAIKFTPSGTVTVAVAEERPPAEDVEQRHVLRFSISDTGIGIPPEQQERIFDSFAQVKGAGSRKTGGTGLGLAIAKSLVESMGGQIRVESEPGAGSRFSFTLLFPAAAAEGCQREEAPSPPVAVGGQRSLRVLVAEDDAALRKLLKITLEQLGHTPHLTSNGVEAVAAIAEQEAFDVILMDVQMPQMDGFEASQHIRQRESGGNGHIPIIGLTAHALPEFRDKCLSAGMDGYLTKPVERAQLAEALQKLPPA